VQFPATIETALDQCHQSLAASGAFFGHGTDNAWDEAVQLVLAVAEQSPFAGTEVLSQPLSFEAYERLCELLETRITDKVPLPYLLGTAWFAGLAFHCDARALVPRSPIAELIVNRFVPWYSGPAPARVLDLCCGGGCIGLAVAHHFPETRVDLIDIDGDALDLAKENAQSLALHERVEILKSNLFEKIKAHRYDLILCNPPYVDARDIASMPAEFHNEPEIALGSGDDGLSLSRSILEQVGNYLQPEGLLVMEVGNSASALESTYPDVPFTWVEFEHGGQGVFVLSAKEWQDYSASWRR